MLQTERFLREQLAIVTSHVDMFGIECMAIFDQFIEQTISIHDTHGIWRKLDARTKLPIVNPNNPEIYLIDLVLTSVNS